jgi:hypothetical protein
VLSSALIHVLAHFQRTTCSQNYFRFCSYLLRKTAFICNIVHFCLWEIPCNHFPLYFSKKRAYTSEGYRKLALLSIDVKRDLIVLTMSSMIPTRHRWNWQELKYIIFRSALVLSSALIHVLAHFQRIMCSQIYFRFSSYLRKPLLRRSTHVEKVIISK